MTTPLLERPPTVTPVGRTPTPTPTPPPVAVQHEARPQPEPAAWIRPWLGLFAIWAILVMTGIVMLSGPALTYGG